ncbi:uncharacterized protein [Argopecten irradians]|uniref:uncharacterized protein isoform X2 n=1 Tax=Argopecten irradians TaxID=31199 RepID=UPI0037217E2A
MSSINISGIPKGLDRRTVSLRIRRDIERVAQVRNVWIQSDQGYGSVSLYDETSAEFVLKLNGKIIINGKTLSLTKLRKRQRVRQTQRPTTLTRRQQVDDDVFVFSGYDSYSSYRKHQPTNDTLFQDINQMPTKKKIKRKSWKNDVILSHVASPKSKSKRNKRRQTKKKKGSRWNSQVCSTHKTMIH